MGDVEVLSQCGGCGLEERIVFNGDQPTRIRYRFGGLNFAPLDLLRISALMPVKECSACHGEPTILPCERCAGLGVEAKRGGPVAMPDLRVTA